MSVPGSATQRASLGTVLAAAAERLDAAGVPSPRHDAELLAAHILGVRRASLLTAPALRPEQDAAFHALITRRATREPLQHLTGVAYFRHLALPVGPGVFIPRPETEGLVDLVLPHVGPGTTLVDLCAGSGAIALAVAAESPGTEVHAVEVDPAAFGWLRRAAAGSPVTVHRAAAGAWNPGRSVDAVVSNPPYLPDGLALEPEVARHDPAAALWGGPDGLDVVREVLTAATRLLRPGGFVALEHDVSHQQELLRLLCQSGFVEVTGHQDLTGRERYVTGRRA